jgi:hypothetical protein
VAVISDHHHHHHHYHFILKESSDEKYKQITGLGFHLPTIWENKRACLDLNNCEVVNNPNKCVL